MSDEAHVRKQIKGYMVVLAALAALTVVTWAVSLIEMPMSGALPLALLIAIIKGSLVACYFMHLISEKKAIIWILILTAIFFLTLIFLPILHFVDPIPGSVG